MNADLLDATPILVIIVVFAILSFACYELAYRVGRWWQARSPGEQEGPTGVLVGSLLGLMAFLLAVTMGMAADRFDTRRGLVVEEANAIGKAYLQADYLPESDAAEMKVLLQEYLPLRVASDDMEQVQSSIKRSLELHGEMWAIAARVAESGHSPDLVSSFGESLTDIVSLNQTRIVSGLYARVPVTILLLLLAGSILSLGMVGFTAGVAGQRSVLSAVVLIMALGATLILVIDLDRPQEGFLQVSQRAFQDVQVWMGSPPP